MKTKAHHILKDLDGNDLEIVSWSAKYATGISTIDKQHRELVDLTNVLFRACLHMGENIDTAFRTAMSNLVKYVRFHFSDEQTLLKRIGFPGCTEHEKEHDDLIKEILEASKNYGAGKKYVPNYCVRMLKDWIFSHIAVSDLVYSTYVREQKKKGLLTDL